MSIKWTLYQQNTRVKNNTVKAILKINIDINNNASRQNYKTNLQLNYQL